MTFPCPTRRVHPKLLWRHLLALLALAFAGGAPALAQAPASCPADGICNGMTYALCIAASCNPETAECGVRATESGWVPCDQAGLDAGTCGPCYIFTGQSCSFNVPCADLKSGILYSTYSERLLEDFGFQWTSCPSASSGMGCMDAVCTPTGQTVGVGGQQIETATCACRQGSARGRMQVASCAVDPCSAVWSTAGLRCQSDAECCSGSCVDGSCGQGSEEGTGGDLDGGRCR